MSASAGVGEQRVDCLGWGTRRKGQIGAHPQAKYRRRLKNYEDLLTDRYGFTSQEVAKMEAGERGELVRVALEAEAAGL